MALRVIGLLRAFALLRLRLFVNQLRGRRRDSLEQVSRISRLFVAATIAVTFIPASVLLALLAFIGGRGSAQGNPKADAVLIGARAVLAVVTIVVAISPIVRFGSTPSSSPRLALLPVPRGLLHAAELLSHLADPWVLAVTPALVALPAGFLAGGAPGAAAFALLLGLVVLALFATLGSSAALVAALLFRNRRIGELATVGVLLLISAAAFLPATMLRGSPAATKNSMALLTARGGGWFEWMPWSLYARAVGDHAAGPALLLASIVLTLYGVSRYAFGRLLDAPAERQRGAARDARVRQLPGLTPAASAIAWETFRLAARSVRGRVILFSNPVPVLMLAIMWKRSSVLSGWGGLAGVIVFGVGSALTLFSLQTLVSNQLAADRAGLTLMFLSPATAREIVLGKAAGGGLAYAVPLSIILGIAAIVHPQPEPALWIASFALAFSAYALQSPVAAAVSAIFPASCDLMKLRAGNVHPLGGLIGMFASVIASACAGAVFAAAYALTGSALSVLAASLVALAVAGAVAAFGLSIAAQAVELRRENVAMIAQGR
jgi:hypothetical protein